MGKVSLILQALEDLPGSGSSSDSSSTAGCSGGGGGAAEAAAAPAGWTGQGYQAPGPRPGRVGEEEEEAAAGAEASTEAAAAAAGAAHWGELLADIKDALWGCAELLQACSRLGRLEVGGWSGGRVVGAGARVAGGWVVAATRCGNGSHPLCGGAHSLLLYTAGCGLVGGAVLGRRLAVANACGITPLAPLQAVLLTEEIYSRFNLAVADLALAVAGGARAVAGAVVPRGARCCRRTTRRLPAASNPRIVAVGATALWMALRCSCKKGTRKDSVVELPLPDCELLSPPVPVEQLPPVPVSYTCTPPLWVQAWRR